MKKLRVALCFAALSALPLLAAIQEPIKVEGGLVSGTPGWGWGVRAYLGIPFAASPVGNLRWRPPQPVVPWQGVRAAREFSPACIQWTATWTDEQAADPGLWHQSEDCLYLNVWTPATSAGDRLPVLVWYHAGASRMGSAARPIYDGNGLAKKGVVVVSANSRPNILGWFAHPELTKESEHHSSGNYGALDQLATLQWVKNNIAQFGGDPNKVTMAGQSTGCATVNLLAASPLAKGLVRGGIGESCGGYMALSMTLSQAENLGARFAKAIGKRTLAELRAMPAEELLAASNQIPGATTGAIVDGWFLPQDLYTIYTEGKQSDIPIIAGSAGDEAGDIFGGTRSANFGSAPDANTVAAYTAWVRATFGAPLVAQSVSMEPVTYLAWIKRTYGARVEAILKLYPAKTDAEAAKAWHDVRRDIAFAPQRAWTQVTAQKSRAYLFLFSHIPPHPAPNGINPVAPPEAGHAAEVRYVFNTLRLKDYEWTDTDRKIADMLGSYWTNFVKNLNPNGPELPNWPAYNPKDEFMMNMGDTFRMERFNSDGVDVIGATEDSGEGER
jgi:carboxylesterase type B